MGIKINKKAQISIFVIVAIAVVVGVLIFFILRSGVVPGIGKKQSEDPQAFLKDCVEDDLKKNAEIISLQGGYFEPEFYRLYEESKNHGKE